MLTVVLDNSENIFWLYEELITPLATLVQSNDD